jgi:hypothetical protein
MIGDGCKSGVVQEVSEAGQECPFPDSVQRAGSRRLSLNISLNKTTSCARENKIAKYFITIGYSLSVFLRTLISAVALREGII